jgi:hypothetical protein
MTLVESLVPVGGLKFPFYLIDKLDDGKNSILFVRCVVGRSCFICLQ